MKGGSFDTVPRKFVSPKSSNILNSKKSLLCKVCSATRILFYTEAYNFSWDEDLKKMDREALTLGDVQTLCFLVVGFLVAAFFVWADELNDFLMEDGGNNNDSDKEKMSIFSGFSSRSSNFHQSVVDVDRISAFYYRISLNLTYPQKRHMLFFFFRTRHWLSVGLNTRFIKVWIMAAMFLNGIILPWTRRVYL